jgi:hypothetical protein
VEKIPVSAHISDASQEQDAKDHALWGLRNAPEGVKFWLQTISRQIPEGFRACMAHVVTSSGVFGGQFDVVIFDIRQIPWRFRFHGTLVVPIESVCAVFEVRHTITADCVVRFRKRVASIRDIWANTALNAHFGAKCSEVRFDRVLGGLLAFENTWSSEQDVLLLKSDSVNYQMEKIDIGCMVDSGLISSNVNGGIDIRRVDRPLDTFLKRLKSEIQKVTDGPEIDFRAYAGWLDVERITY